MLLEKACFSNKRLYGQGMGCVLWICWYPLAVSLTWYPDEIEQTFAIFRTYSAFSPAAPMDHKNIGTRMAPTTFCGYNLSGSHIFFLQKVSEKSLVFVLTLSFWFCAIQLARVGAIDIAQWQQEVHWKDPNLHKTNFPFSDGFPLRNAEESGRKTQNCWVREFPFVGEKPAIYISVSDKFEQCLQMWRKKLS